MDNIERKGTIAIRQGNDNHEPRAVYVGGVNSFDMLVCRVLNTGEILFSMPEKDDLLEFDIKTLQRLRAEWRLANAQRSVERFQKQLDEGDY